MTDGHTVPLPGTDWTVWRDAVVRSTGFPADGLDRFAAPELARVADACLDGRASEDELATAHAAALDDASRTAEAIAADPLFREAVAWQNPGIGPMLRRLSAGESSSARSPRRKRQKRRQREDTVALYWQRYCGKNDTIGFFGPVTWAKLASGGSAVRVECGERLTRRRETFYEFWALEAYVETLAADPVVRPWLPVGLNPHLTLDGDQVLRPDGPPLALTGPEAKALAACDGRRPATEAGPLDVLAGLAERDIVWWGVNMPYNPEAENVLRATLSAIPDPAARERALAGLHRLDAARSGVAAAAGDPDRLAEALAGLDAEFTAITGATPSRRAGQMYAGRRLCYEETTRDIDLTIGGPILEALSGPFGRVLLPMARWISANLIEVYADAFRALYAQTGPVPLGEFWGPAVKLVAGEKRPADELAAEFARRWRDVLGIDRTDVARVEIRSEDVAERVAELFTAERAGWANARIHSPDLHICAPSVEALERGEFTIVLGELHVGWPTLDCAVFTDRHPDPAELRAYAAEDIGPQLRPLYPTWWTQYTARIAPNLGVSDRQIAFTAAPGADPARLLSISALTVRERDGVLAAVAPDGRSWPLTEVFALIVGWLGADIFKTGLDGPHMPRLTIDRLVVARETWRMTIGETGLADVGGRVPEYLAARRLRARYGLPERVFVKLGTEVKPTYLDFTSPRYISTVATMLRTARAKNGDDVRVTMSELLPVPEDAWLPDAQGRGYFSELRIQFVDPVPYA